MKIIRIKPNYIPLTQQKYCCVPCCLQWILLRSGLKMFSQDQLAKDLGVVIPPEDQRLFNIKQKTLAKLPKGKGGYGVWTYKFPQVIKKYGWPLMVRRFYPSKIPDVKKFLADNLSAGNDIIVTFNVAAYAKPGSGVNYGHACIIDSLKINGKKAVVILGDPSFSHRKFFEIDLQKLLSGMSTKYGKEKSFKVFYGK